MFLDIGESSEKPHHGLRVSLSKKKQLKIARKKARMHY